MINKMKNWLKIWVVALAICATAAALLSTGNVQAQSNSDKKVEVVIGQYNSGQNDCTWDDYLIHFDASTVDQTGSDTWHIECKFGDKNETPVSLGLQWALELSGNTSVTIPTSRVLLTNGTWTTTPEGIEKAAAPVFTEQEFAWADVKELFTKKVNTIGDANGTDIVITVGVSAWQPDGTYNGVLVLSYPWA